jgi:hypothetical protein
MNKSAFSPRAFLRSRQAVLVHFSTVMAGRPDLLFPEDLRQAITLKGAPLSFSTIQDGDTNPHMAGRGGAEGSVGLLIDLGPSTLIDSVSPGDSGSSAAGSLGVPPTEESCTRSIDARAKSNEWRVQDYVPIGIFILPPIRVRQAYDVGGVPTVAEGPMTLGKVIDCFPGKRIFSANAHTFLEWDRASGGWRAIPYDDIFRHPPPEPDDGAEQ